jgi:hypothetical protein
VLFYVNVGLLEVHISLPTAVFCVLVNLHLSNKVIFVATCKHDFDAKLSWDVLMILVEMPLSTLLYYAAAPLVRSPQSIICSTVSMLTSKEIKHWERGLKICNDNFYRTYSLHRLPQQKPCVTLLHIHKQFTSQ